MFQEAGSAPDAVAEHLCQTKDRIGELVQLVCTFDPQFVATCARGSSDHAATFGKYLIETRVGLPVVSLAPSIASVFKAPIKLGRALFITVSQSGASPDLITAAGVAKAEGALVIGLINAPGSGLEEVCDHILPLCAGPEESVAATKSYILSLVALAGLVARWSGDQNLTDGLGRLPQALGRAWKQDWSSGVSVLSGCTNLFVISRGLGLGIAQEAALKFKETSGIHAEALSAAEVRHGPMALVQNGFPILLFPSPDIPGADTDQMAKDFLKRGATLVSVGRDCKGAVILPFATMDASVLDYILMIQSFYRMMNAVALARGYNPDKPPFLKKVTETV